MADGMTFVGGAGGLAQPAPQPEPATSCAVPSQGRELPPDLPDEVEGVVPEFRSRRKAELLPPLKPVWTGSSTDPYSQHERRAAASNGLDPTWCRRLAWADWQAGFRWGVFATVGGTCLFLALAVGMLK